MRNVEMVTERNDKIFARYGEMYFGQLMRDDEIYKVLETEFYLSKRTLYHIVLHQSKKQYLKN